jgi:hypothetical protein
VISRSALTYEGLRADLNEAIERQERILKGRREAPEGQVQRTVSALPTPAASVVGVRLALALPCAPW